MLEHFPWLSTTALGNPIWRWILALLGATALVAAFFVFRRVVVARLVRLAERSKNGFDDIVAVPTKATNALLVVVLAVVGGSHLLLLPATPRRVLDACFMVALATQLGLWVQAIGRAALDAWAKRQERSGGATVAAGLTFALRVAVWSVIVLLILANLGVRIDALVAGLGIGGVAAALAVQNVLGDVFASLALYFDRPFDLGDFVVVGDVQGTVERIGVRSTRIVALSGEQVIFPNAKLAGNTIRNFRRMEERRVVLTLGIAGDTSPEKIERAVAICRESIEAEEGVRFDRAHFKGFGAYSLDCECVYFVLSREQAVFMDRQQSINLRILRRFADEGVHTAIPLQMVRVLRDEAAPS
ncbi:MAG: mechanosensitive ion channel family protein [Deltaproteobacteria bacterium]|nr:mechanosensitive ion channel family protein [Deltaproteobacteria bacterium]